jgi:uncharacterized membrane protein YdjX (TVP38/TMEM64 family)
MNPNKIIKFLKTLSWKRVLTSLGGFLIGFIIFLWLGTVVGFDNLEKTVEDAGALATIVYLMAVSSVFVFAPLSANLIYVSGGFLFGTVPGFFLTWVGVLIGSTLNFFIARTLGRKAVSWLLGEDTMIQVDRFTNRISDRHRLIFITLFTPFASDFMSYAIGLTTMKYYAYLRVIFITQGLYLGLLMFGIIDLLSELV